MLPPFLTRAKAAPPAGGASPLRYRHAGAAPERASLQTIERKLRTDVLMSEGEARRLLEHNLWQREMAMLTQPLFTRLAPEERPRAREVQERQAMRLRRRLSNAAPDQHWSAAEQREPDAAAMQSELRRLASVLGVAPPPHDPSAAVRSDETVKSLTQLGRELLGARAMGDRTDSQEEAAGLAARIAELEAQMGGLLRSARQQLPAARHGGRFTGDSTPPRLSLPPPVGLAPISEQQPPVAAPLPAPPRELPVFALAAPADGQLQAIEAMQRHFGVIGAPDLVPRQPRRGSGTGRSPCRSARWRPPMEGDAAPPADAVPVSVVPSADFVQRGAPLPAAPPVPHLRAMVATLTGAAEPEPPPALPSTFRPAPEAPAEAPLRPAPAAGSLFSMAEATAAARRV